MVLFILHTLSGFRWPRLLTHGVAMSTAIYLFFGFCEVHLVVCAALSIRALASRVSGADASVQLVYRRGIALMSCGLLVWLLEVTLSHRIATQQLEKGGLWSFIQLHAFWHVFMAVGVYYTTVAAMALVHSARTTSDGWFGLPRYTL